MPRFIFFLFASFLSLLSCNSGPDRTDPPPPEVHIPDARLRELGMAIADEFNEGSGPLFDSVMDPVALAVRAFWPDTLTGDERALLIEAARRGPYREAESLGNVFAEQFRAAGTVRFVRVERGHRGVWLLFRVERPNGTVSYFRLLAADGDNGLPALADMYSTTSGENLSRTLQRVFQGGEGENIGKRFLAEGDSIPSLTLKAWRKMQGLMAEKRHEEILRCFDSLSVPVRQHKILQLMRLRAALNVRNEQQYAAAIREMLERYPDDPEPYLSQVDYYMMHKRYDSVLAAYERLDRRVGDPYLDYQRAWVYMEKGDMAQASRLAEQVMAWDSTLVDPYYVLIAVAIGTKDHRAAAAALERMQQSGTAEIDFEGIESSEDYEDFILSKEYGALKRKYE